MSLVVSGYDDDKRELVDVPEVRKFLAEFTVQWPYWAFFLNQVDDSILILGSCTCGKSYPGKGAVESRRMLLCGIQQFQRHRGRAEMRASEVLM